jgi:hypothetical protein
MDVFLMLIQDGVKIFKVFLVYLLKFLTDNLIAFCLQVDLFALFHDGFNTHLIALDLAGERSHGVA